MTNRRGTITDPQRTYLARLVNEAFVVGYEGYIPRGCKLTGRLPDANHLDTYGKEDASYAIAQLSEAKREGWPGSRKAENEARRLAQVEVKP